MHVLQLRLLRFACIGLFSLSALAAHAEMVATDSGIAVKESAVTTPARGATMEEVTAKFGAPVSKVPGVGNPPISRWEYSGFIVYFEFDHVVHTVIANS
jgi:hypothetical protein